METVASSLLDYGLLGIIVAVLGWAYWQERAERNQLQDKRLDELKELLKALQDNTTSLKTLAKLIETRLNE